VLPGCTTLRCYGQEYRDLILHTPDRLSSSGEEEILSAFPDTGGQFVDNEVSLAVLCCPFYRNELNSVSRQVESLSRVRDEGFEPPMAANLARRGINPLCYRYTNLAWLRRMDLNHLFSRKCSERAAIAPSSRFRVGRDSGDSLASLQGRQYGDALSLDTVPMRSE
jgi:hypothetical protein